MVCCGTMVVVVGRGVGNPDSLPLLWAWLEPISHQTLPRAHTLDPTLKLELASVDSKTSSSPSSSAAGRDLFARGMRNQRPRHQSACNSVAVCCGPVLCRYGGIERQDGQYKGCEVLSETKDVGGGVIPSVTTSRNLAPKILVA